MSASQQISDQQFLTIKEFSAVARLSVVQIRRLVKAGRIPCHQPGGPGGKLLFKPDALTSVGPSESKPNTKAARPKGGRRPVWKSKSPV